MYIFIPYQVQFFSNLPLLMTLILFLTLPEDFYLGPLKSIDRIISKKLVEIDKKVQWKEQFTVPYYILQNS